MARRPANLTLKPEDVELWLHRISQGDKRVKDMRRATKPYREAWHGKFPQPYPEEDENQQVYVNRVHRVVLQWNGAMYAQNPSIDLKPPWREGGLPRKNIAMQKAIINAEMDRIKLDQPVKKAITTALLDGWGWSKSGFHAEWEELISDTEEVTSNADAENEGFNLGPEFYPKEVLLHEEHEVHEEAHKRYRQDIQTRLQQMHRSYMQQVEQGAPQEQTIEAELIRFDATIRAVKRHEAAHVKMREKRDREGKNQPNVRILAENCWTDYVHNSNVIWDLHATGPHDWRFTAERIVKTVTQWKDIFKGKDIEQNYSGPVPGSTGVEEDATTGGGVSSNMLTHRGKSVYDGDADPDDLATVWKIWDAEHRRVIWIQEEQDNELRIDPWPHRFIRTPPLRMLWFESREDEFYPVSPVSHFWSQQLEINRYRTKAGIIARRSKAVGIAGATVPDEFLSDLAGAPDMTIKKLTGLGTKPNEAFMPIEWGKVPVDVHQMAAFAQEDLQMDTGLGEQSLGGATSAKTATAARVGASAVGVTLDVKLRCVEEFVGQIVEDHRSLMRQYYTQERFGTMQWEGVDEDFVWTGETLGEFGIKVELGSSRKEEKEVERMQAMEMFQMLGQVPGVDVLKLAEWVMSKHGIRDPDEFIQDQGTQAPNAVPMGPGQGQNQTQAPTQGGAEQPSADYTKVGG